MAKVVLTPNWQKVTITKDCAIQNTGEKKVRVAITETDVTPSVKDTGFILTPLNSISVKSGEIVYARSDSVTASSTVEVG